MLACKAYEGILNTEDFKRIEISINNEPDIEKLRNIFISFCSFSSPLVIDRLTQANFIRLLKISHIFEDSLISPNSAQAIYVKLTKDRNLSYLTYEMFLEALETISEQKYPLTFNTNPETACKLLLNMHIFPYASGVIDTESKFEKSQLPQKSEFKTIPSKSPSKYSPKISQTFDMSLQNPTQSINILPESQKLTQSFIENNNNNTNTNAVQNPILTDNNTATSTNKLKIFENKRLLKVLRIVYDHYMCKDIKSVECRNKVTQEGFLKMMQNFKICPILCPKVVLRQYFQCNY